jgi:hypothetical protein
VETPPARVIRGRLSFGARTGLAARAVIAAWPTFFRMSATPVGFAAALRSVGPVPRLIGVSSMLIGPTCRSSAAPFASVRSRDPTVTSGSPGAAGSASGAVSADQVCHAARRSRLGFYAQGRTFHDGLNCHGLLVLSRVFVARSPRRHSWQRANARGLGRRAAVRLQIASRRPMPALRRVRRGRRLIGPAVFPPGQCPRLRFLRRPPNVRRLASTRGLTGLL